MCCYMQRDKLLYATYKWQYTAYFAYLLQILAFFSAKRIACGNKNRYNKNNDTNIRGADHMHKQLIDTAARGQRIRDLREKKNLTLDALAAMLDINKSTLSRHEHGSTSRINRAALEKIAELLDTTYEYIQFGTGSIHPSNAMEITLGNPDDSLQNAQIEYSRNSSSSLRSYDLSDQALAADAEANRNKNLTVIVDSSEMTPRINPGDKLIVRSCGKLVSDKVNLFVGTDGKTLMRDVIFQDDSYIFKSRDGRYLKVIKEENLEKTIGKIIGYCIGMQTSDI